MSIDDDDQIVMYGGALAPPAPQLPALAALPTAAGTLTTAAVPNPGIAIGDILVAVGITYDVNPITPPAGAWALRASATVAVAVGPLTATGSVHIKRADAADVAAPTFTFTGGTDSTSVGIIPVRHCLQVGDPLDAITALPCPVAPPAATGLVTSGLGRFLILATATADNRTYSAYTVVDPGALTECLEFLNAGGDDSGVGAAADLKPAAGATGDGTWNMVFSPLIGFLIALLPEV